MISAQLRNPGGGESYAAIDPDSSVHMLHHMVNRVWQYTVCCLTNNDPCSYSGGAYSYSYFLASANGDVFPNSNTTRHRPAAHGRHGYNPWWPGHIGGSAY